MKLNSFILIITILISRMAYAQNSVINGHLYDTITHENISFATIIISNTYFTHSNIDGNFKVPTSVFHQGDTITITALGYKAQIMKMNEISFLNFSMEPQVYALNEIKITHPSQKKKKKKEIVLNPLSLHIETFCRLNATRFGNEQFKSRYPEYFGNDYIPKYKAYGAFQCCGMINAIFFDNKDEYINTPYIKEIAFYVAKDNKHFSKCFMEEKDHAFFRIRIYDNNNGMPDHDILTSNVFSSNVYSSSSYKVDISKYKIKMVQGGIFVGLELYENDGSHLLLTQTIIDNERNSWNFRNSPDNTIKYNWLFNKWNGPFKGTFPISITLTE